MPSPTGWARSFRQRLLFTIRLPSAVAQAQRLPASVCGPAAIDGERMAIYECALPLVGEKRNCARDVVRSGKAAHGNAARDVRVDVGAARLVGCVHLGLYPAGTNGIHPDPASTPLGSKRSRQADQSML